MRKKERFIINGIVIIGVGLSIIDLIMQYFELKDKGKKLNWENFDGERTLKKGIIGGVIGAGIGYGTYQYSVHQESKNTFNSDKYLKQVLNYYNLKNDSELFQEVLKVRQEVKQVLHDQFDSSLISQPFDTGSFAKRTLVTTSYDLDIIVPFSKNCGLTTESMFKEVYSTLRRNLPSEYTALSKQTKAISIIYCSGSGKEISIDIVPGRERNNFKVDGELTLFKRSKSFFNPSSTIKANPSIHRDITINKPSERNIIRLIKIWRDKECLNIPSGVIDVLVIRAFENGYGHSNSSLKSNLVGTMKYIGDYVLTKDVSDFANSNNKLCRSMSSYDRSLVSKSLLNDVKKIEDRASYLKEIFEI